MGKIIEGGFTPQGMDEKQKAVLVRLYIAATEAVDEWVENEKVSDQLILIHAEIEEILEDLGIASSSEDED